MKSQISKGIYSIFCANIINLVLGLVSGFMLPKFLTISTYASIKTYQLYISYAGLLTFGYIDGMYLKFGGKELISIELNDLRKNAVTFRILQGVFLPLSFLAVYRLKSSIYAAFLVSLYFLNMINYFRVLFQATGEFDKYGRILNISSVFKFCLNLLLIVVMKCDNSLVFIYGYILVDSIVYLVIELYIRHRIGLNIIAVGFCFKECIECIKDGLLLMLGYFVSVVMTSMDRWFVKLLMNVTAFAQYSFAVTIESFLDVCVSPVSITMYNYFCKNHESENIYKTKRYIIIFATLIVAAAFPAKLVIESFLMNYIETVPVLFFLFAAQIFYIVNKTVYVNLYRVYRKQKSYFYKLILIVVVGFALNAILFYFIRRQESFAVGTYLTSLIWMIISGGDFDENQVMFTELFYLIIESIVFVLCGICFKSYLGFAIYIIFSGVHLKLFFDIEIKELYRIVKRRI